MLQGKRYTNFVHLHVHSHYSLLDGAAPVKAIVDAAKRFNMPAVCITDHGNMFAAIELYHEAMKKGLKPIMGFEAYITAGSRFEKTKESLRNFPTHHLVLLARNQTGYKNLLKLASVGHIEGFYYKPRIDHEILEKHSEGLIGLSACLAGEIPAALLKDDKEKAKSILKYYQSVFGKENFYVEIQNHGLDEQLKVLRPLIELARECEAPLVATNDSHYVNPEDWETQDALLAMSTQKTLDDPERFRFGSKEFYYKSPSEMETLFGEWPEALTNTVRIADRCNVTIKFGESLIPVCPVPEGKTEESYVREICYKGFKENYGDNPPEGAMERLEFELETIKKMGYFGYFLIVWEFINWARTNGIPVGPGRGSAAGAIVAYCMHITDIDPIKYDLLFERFLNPERISMPDIDVDFSDDGRPDVIRHVQELYGVPKVSQIITFNYMLAKNAIRGVGRIMGMPVSEVGKIAKLVPDKPGTHLKKCLEEVPELKNLKENGTEEEKKLLRLATSVDGLASHTGVHACGIIISSMNLDEVSPVTKDPNAKEGDLSLVVSQYEKHAVEDIGLLKMDFLGLKTLSVLKNAFENVEETHSDADPEQKKKLMVLRRFLDLRKKQDPNNIPDPKLEEEINKEAQPLLEFNDPGVYDLLQKGLTLGVFQLESAGMRGLLKRLLPSEFTDIIALLAMYRPGPLKSGMVDDFVERKHGRAELTYPHPSLEPVLKDTYGVYLYQEQVMLTSRVLAGFTKGQADSLRKAMGKKIKEKMEEMGKKFIEGSIKNGVDPDLAKKIFDLMAGFAEYGFNKSHSAAYAVVTYRTAYMKAHYPAEFMASCLTSETDDTDKIAEYVDECRALGIEVLPPDVNHSKGKFRVEGKKIRYGLSALKGVGSGPVEAIENARDKGGPFKDLGDFIQRVDSDQINVRVLDALVKSGAFDCFGLKKSQLLQMCEEGLKQTQVQRKAKNSGQATFFDLLGDDAEGMGNIDIKIPNIPEFSDKELLQAEKEVFGFYFIGNPYDPVSPIGKVFANTPLSNLAKYSKKADSNEEDEEDSSSEVNLAAFDGSSYRVCGILAGLKKVITKKGDTMAFITIEANNASLEVTVFPKTYEECGSKLQIDEPLFMIIRTQIMDGVVKANAEKIFVLEDLDQEGFTKLSFNIPKGFNKKSYYDQLLEVLRKSPGQTSFTISITTDDDKKVTLRPPSKFRVALNPVLIKEWENICGRNSLKIDFPALDSLAQKSGFKRRLAVAK
ncbi:MAG: DNA polymerase III subunit alpha [Candidatus Riflebacteria bacterium]|nr:DNA polymerase III subunit alpha [Candidatus Riflebacteria bacterium]